MNALRKILTFLLFAFLWLFLSPLFVMVKVFLLKGKLKTNLFYAGLSPSTWILVVAAYLFGASYYDQNFKLTGKKELSQVTGVDLPSFRIVDKDLGSKAFNGDHTNNYVIEFDELPDEGFYLLLDSVCKDDSYWSKSVEATSVLYSYSRMWGNGLEAPEGQDSDEDLSISLTIVKGELKARLSKASW